MNAASHCQFERVWGRGEADKLSLPARPPFTPVSGRTTYHGFLAPKRLVAPLGHLPRQRATALIRGYHQQRGVILKLAFAKVTYVGEYAAIQLARRARAIGFGKCGEALLPEFLSV
jgi:hypothetical protein